MFGAGSTDPLSRGVPAGQSSPCATSRRRPDAPREAGARSAQPRRRTDLAGPPAYPISPCARHRLFLSAGPAAGGAIPHPVSPHPPPSAPRGPLARYGRPPAGAPPPPFPPPPVFPRGAGSRRADASVAASRGASFPGPRPRSGCRRAVGGGRVRAKVVACSVVATRGGAAPPEGVLAVTGEAAAAGSAGGSRQASLGRF